MQLTFFPNISKGTRNMHSTSDDIEIMIGNETNEITEDPFHSLLQNIKKGKKNKWNEANLQRITKINSFINKYNCKETNFPSHKNNWKKFETNNKIIALNILYIAYNTKELKYAYISKPSSTRKKWHYLAVKKLYALFRKTTSKHDEDFYCFNCLPSFSTENELKEHENIRNSHDCCSIEMLRE